MKQINLSVDGRSLAERVTGKIEELIRDGVFAPGDKLPNEYDLSEMLQVGRSTLRESIKILESRHVLRIKRGFGTYVCMNVGITKDPFGLRFVDEQKKLSLDLCQVRMMLEPSIARLAARHAAKKDVEEIQKLCDEIAELVHQRKNYGKKDMAFHAKIAESTGSLVTPRLIPIICNGIETYVEITNFSQIGSTLITHQKIADAIRAHDEDAAFAAMEQHIKDNRAILESLPEADFSL